MLTVVVTSAPGVIVPPPPPPLMRVKVRLATPVTWSVGSTVGVQVPMTSSGFGVESKKVSPMPKPDEVNVVPSRRTRETTLDKKVEPVTLRVVVCPAVPKKVRWTCCPSMLTVTPVAVPGVMVPVWSVTRLSVALAVPVPPCEGSASNAQVPAGVSGVNPSHAVTVVKL